ncbi:MAG: TRAP transporter substrate-binding protein [Gammaproteobacteria bacterium]|nr:TRAP transporter substrate-binding protein [Gammaproteobacteria bacterium]
MQRRSLFVAAAVAAIMAIGAGAADAQKMLKLGSVGRPGVPLGDAMADGLVPATAKASGGQLTIEGHYRGSICGEQKCGEQANQGLIAIWSSSTANFGSFGTALSIFDLPYLFSSLDWANKISDSWLGEAQSKEAEKTTQHKVFEVFSSGGFRQLGNAARPVHEPKDMKGIKFRVTKSPIEYTLIKTWGAIPVPYDWLQLYQGLQTGVVEGQYVQVPWQELYKMYEVQKYYTEVGGAWGGNHLSMDLNQYNDLTADEKMWLKAGTDAFSEMARRLDSEWVAAGIEKIKAKIEEWYKPNDAEMELWRSGAVGAWADAKGAYDPKLAERALAEQGLDSFIDTLKKGGAL